MRPTKIVLNSLTITSFLLARVRSQVWWYTPVILALRTQRQEDREFEADLGYNIRIVSKKTQNNNNNKIPK
jgi:hypothetical protein